MWIGDQKATEIVTLPIHVKYRLMYTHKAPHFVGYETLDCELKQRCC